MQLFLNRFSVSGEQHSPISSSISPSPAFLTFVPLPYIGTRLDTVCSHPNEVTAFRSFSLFRSPGSLKHSNPFPARHSFLISEYVLHQIPTQTPSYTIKTASSIKSLSLGIQYPQSHMLSFHTIRHHTPYCITVTRRASSHLIPFHPNPSN